MKIEPRRYDRSSASHYCSSFQGGQATKFKTPGRPEFNAETVYHVVMIAWRLSTDSSCDAVAGLLADRAGFSVPAEPSLYACR